MTEQTIQQVSALAATIAELDKSSKRRGLDSFQRANLVDQRNSAIDALIDFLRANPDWYTCDDPSQLPPLLSITTAARYTGLEVRHVKYLVRNDWEAAGVIKRFGTRGIAIRAKQLIEWLNG